MNRRIVLYLLTAFALVAATPPARAQTNCVIDGPGSAGINQAFTLCGPSGYRLSYEWFGPGLVDEGDGRCVTARVSTPGTYEYLLVLRRDGAEVDRCRKNVNVGGTSGGTRSCTISGPTSIRLGQTARLCGPDDPLHTYSWTGPNGFRATGACVTVDDEGTYYLTSRNTVTGSTRQCTHQLTVIGGGDTGGGGDCISGPRTLPRGGSARLCAPQRSNWSYRWTGPGGFNSTARCVDVDEPGTYTVTMRGGFTNQPERCSHTIVFQGEDTGEGEEGDEVIYDNCPRPWQFWRDAFNGNSADRNLNRADLQAVARFVDERSTYFNWRDDAEGMRQALSPGSPLTRRKQVVRQYAALLANVAAGELSVTPEGRNQISLDLDTSIDYPGASTIRDLIRLTERTLGDRRGNYSRLNSILTRINRGQGIGPVCD